MRKLAKLAEALKPLDDKLAKCMKCGTCQSVCPIFAETLSEGDVARGKVALISDLSKSLLSDAEGVREKLDRCLLCGSCQAACPSGVKLAEIFISAREICAEYMGLSPIKKAVFRLLISKPKFFAFATSVGLLGAKIFLRDEKNTARTVCSTLLTPFVGERKIPKTPTKTFSAETGEVRIQARLGAPTVLFMTGCMGDKLYTDVTKDCVKILRHFGCGVIVLKDQPCCGIPALASGDKRAFREMAIKNVEAISTEKFDFLVTACASCAETAQKFWLNALKNSELEDKAIDIAKKTREISQFLIDELKIESLPEFDKNQTSSSKTLVTYHDSCHLAKALGVREQPRKLLKLAKNVEFVEMKESDRCCGCGGSFTLTHYPLSRKIGERKRGNIIKTNASSVAAGCPACMMQITNMLALNADKLRVRHVAQYLADEIED